jgi:hypothetical protein
MLIVPSAANALECYRRPFTGTRPLLEFLVQIGRAVFTCVPRPCIQVGIIYRNCTHGQRLSSSKFTPYDFQGWEG